MNFQVVQLPESYLANTNKVYVSENSEFIKKFININNIIYFAESHGKIEKNQIALNLIQRKQHSLTLMSFQNISTVSKLSELNVVQCLLSIPDNKFFTLDCEEFEMQLKIAQMLNPLTESQQVYFGFNSIPFTITVKTVTLEKNEESVLKFFSTPIPTNCGIITENTRFVFESESKNLKLKNVSSSVGNKLFKHDINFSSLGIGGLDDQFKTLFRSAFASRMVPKAIADKMKLKHRKGVLLYGPPGTGKTLIARQIGKALNCAEPKIVNGPELLDKYVGGSEEKLRALFRDAEIDRDSGVDNIHVIIFDEADALFRKRGSRSSSTGVEDSLVNQILSKVDGVDELNNLLIIAMTNRKDVIDEAIIRSGRLDIHIEIGLPNEKGRQDILNIHTTNIKDRLSSDVDLGLIAKITKNYTGAELQQLVTSATSFSITREIDLNDLKKSQNMNPIITQNDFLNAIEDVPTLFGKIADEIGLLTNQPFIKWNEMLDTNDYLIKEGIKSVKFGNNISYLVTGSTNIGKTKFLAHIIKDLDIACTKMLSPEVLLRTNNIQATLCDMIDACSRAEISVLFVDGFERLIKWSRYGHKYDNDVLQLLMMLLRLPQKPDKKLIIFCTANESEVLRDLDIYDMFDHKFDYPEFIEYENVKKYFPQTIDHINIENYDKNIIPISEIMKIVKHTY